MDYSELLDRLAALDTCAVSDALDSLGVSGIVVEQKTGVNAACWGGVLAHAAKLKRIRGIVIEGSARDIDELGEVGIPVFSRDATTKSARGRIHEGEPATEVLGRQYETMLEKEKQ